MDTQKALAHLERFCHQVSKGLTSLTFDERQQLLRLVIERISVENGVARIDAVIPPDQDNLRNRYPELVEGCGVADDYCRPVVRQAHHERGEVRV